MTLAKVAEHLGELPLQVAFAEATVPEHFDGTFAGGMQYAYGQAKRMLEADPDFTLRDRVEALAAEFDREGVRVQMPEGHVATYPDLGKFVAIRLREAMGPGGVPASPATERIILGSAVDVTYIDQTGTRQAILLKTEPGLYMVSLKTLPADPLAKEAPR